MENTQIKEIIKNANSEELREIINDAKKRLDLVEAPIFETYEVQEPKKIKAMKIRTLNLIKSQADELDQHMFGRYSSRCEVIREFIKDAIRFNRQDLVNLIIEESANQDLSGKQQSMKVVTVNNRVENLEFLIELQKQMHQVLGRTRKISRSEIMRCIIAIFMKAEQNETIRTILITKTPVQAIETRRTAVEQYKFMGLMN